MIPQTNAHLSSIQNGMDKTIDAKKSIAVPLVTIINWSLFLGNAIFLVFNYPNIPEWNWAGIFRINGFTILIWTTVTIFSSIVCSYASNYLTGFKYHARFMWLCLGFTLAVMLLVMANHVFLLIFSWWIMGVFMSQLIGIDKAWGEAREASKFTLRYFITGTFF